MGTHESYLIVNSRVITVYICVCEILKIRELKHIRIYKLFANELESKDMGSYYL